MMLSGDKMKVNSKMSHELKGWIFSFESIEFFKTMGGFIGILADIVIGSGSLHRA